MVAPCHFRQSTTGTQIYKLEVVGQYFSYGIIVTYTSIHINKFISCHFIHITRPTVQKKRNPFLNIACQYIFCSCLLCSFTFCCRSGSIFVFSEQFLGNCRTISNKTQRDSYIYIFISNSWYLVPASWGQWG